MNSARDDLRFALRSLRRRPILTTAAALTLALGIGVNATMFGIVDRLLVRPPAHVQEPERVVRFYTTASSPGPGQEPFTTVLADHQTYTLYRDNARSLSHVAGFMQRELTLGRGLAARQIDATLATASLFPMLGVQAVRGRFFAEEDDRASATPTVVLSHELWESQFGGRASVVGETIHVAGREYTVIGIAPPEFTGIELGTTDLWLPLHVAYPAAFGTLSGPIERIGGFYLDLAARLRPGITSEAASAEATSLRRGNPSPSSMQSSLTTTLGPAIEERGLDASDDVRIATWVAWMSIVVLLIACANVANLLVARAVERRREIAVRLALGVTRWRLARLVMIEALALATSGAMLAILLSLWTTDLLRATLLPDITWATRPLDPRILGATAVIALVAGVLAGFIPALRAGHGDLTPALKQGERSHGSASHAIVRRSLLVVQGALSVILLIGAGLFVRSMDQLHAVDLGIDPDALVAQVHLETAGYKEADVAAFFERAVEAVRPLPSVERVALAATTPFGSAYGSSVRIPGRDSLPELPSGGPYEYVVSPGYFATIGTSLLRGRDFSENDRAGATPVMIINETMARAYWPNENPLGQCAVLSTGVCAEVVGIVENARRFQLQEEPSALFYIPVAQSAGRHAASQRVLVARARNNARDAARDVRVAIQSLAPNLPFVNVQPLRERIDPQLRPWRLGAVLFSTFGVIALLVGATGLYGVINFGVVQRRPEFAIRGALGQRAPAMVRSVLAEAVRYMALAVALGTLASLALGRVVESLLYGVSPYDVTVYVTVTLLLLTIALVAAAIPALRAARVNPAEALRAD